MWKKISNSKVWKFLTKKFVLSTLFFLFWILLLDENTIFDILKIQSNISKQEREIVYYKNQIKEIEVKLKELESNKDSLEKFAREEYYFQKPGEEVFVIAPE